LLNGLSMNRASLACREFSNLQNGVREGALRLSGCVRMQGSRDALDDENK
jgi:hypothetical protein